LVAARPPGYNRPAMDESPRSGVWLIVAVAALLAIAAVVWLPINLSPQGAQSPLQTPDSAAASLPPMAKAGITLLVVALGIGISVVVVLIDRRRHARRRE